MNRQMKWALSIYGVIIAAFFGIHYIFLKGQGFNAENYLLGWLFLFPATLIVGYIFIFQVLEQHESREEQLEHLVREVLHEINLPVATIEANLSMIRRDLSGDGKNIRRLDRILSASRRLKKLYRQLSYNIRREIAPVEKESFDLASMLRERIAEFESLGRQSFYLETEDLAITADRIGLEQVIDNLLENAMKYSGADSTIKICLRGTELKIIDEGIGMDENEILRIYERYYQGDRRAGGEGIGLALVKRYCDENRLKLRILSSPGKGTGVHIDFASCAAARSSSARQSDFQ
jgi:signal transduction histidine kinase